MTEILEEDQMVETFQQLTGTASANQTKDASAFIATPTPRDAL